MIPSNFLSHFSQNHHSSTIITTITKSPFSSVWPTWSSGASSSSANLLWGENREPLRRKGWHPNSWPGTHSRKSIKLIWPTKHKTTKQPPSGWAQELFHPCNLGPVGRADPDSVFLKWLASQFSKSPKSPPSSPVVQSPSTRRWPQEHRRCPRPPPTRSAHPRSPFKNIVWMRSSANQFLFITLWIFAFVIVSAISTLGATYPRVASWCRTVSMMSAQWRTKVPTTRNMLRNPLAWAKISGWVRETHITCLGSSQTVPLLNSTQKLPRQALGSHNDIHGIEPHLNHPEFNSHGFQGLLESGVPLPSSCCDVPNQQVDLLKVRLRQPRHDSQSEALKCQKYEIAYKSRCCRPIKAALLLLVRL